MTFEHRHHARCACGSALSSQAAASRPFALAGAKRVYERSRPFAIHHIALVLELQVEQKAIRGTATLDVARVDPAAAEIALDAVGFDIEAVEARLYREGAFAPAAHVYDGETLRVTLPAGAGAAQIRVAYRAVPRRGIYFLAPDEHVTDRPRQVWTQCQDEDARHIFPCHDKPHVKQTTEVTVTVPAGWYALSNGELVSESAGTFHWKMSEPHPSYLFTLVAGEFARIDDEVDGVPLSYLVPRGREADGRRTFARTPAMIRRFGAILGVPYPWNKYAQVVVSDFIFGGMENTTATTMYEHILLDERAALDVSSDDLIAHELAHQWFGDLVTCRDWSHGWLNEGFATFMEHVDRESHLGRDEYDYGVKGDGEAYFGEARGRYKRPIVCQDYEAPIDIFDRHLYEKGACVLHMLRRELGDALFFGGVRAYLTRHRKSVVETRDLMRALEEVSGRSLERFFEQWVYRPGHPELEIKIEHEGEVLTVTVKQTQGGVPPSHGGPSGNPDPAVPIFAFDLALDLGLRRRDPARGAARRSGLVHLRLPRPLPAALRGDRPGDRGPGGAQGRGPRRHAPRAARGGRHGARAHARRARAGPARRSALDQSPGDGARRRQRVLGGPRRGRRRAREPPLGGGVRGAGGERRHGPPQGAARRGARARLLQDRQGRRAARRSTPSRTRATSSRPRPRARSAAPGRRAASRPSSTSSTGRRGPTSFAPAPSTASPACATSGRSPT